MIAFYFQLKQYKAKMWMGLDRGETVQGRPKVLVVLVEGLVFVFFFSSLFLLIPAVVFTKLEDDGQNTWDYVNSVYYTFITLSTIGFGDMVPGMSRQSPHTS